MDRIDFLKIKLYLARQHHRVLCIKSLERQKSHEITKERNIYLEYRKTHQTCIDVKMYDTRGSAFMGKRC